MSNKSLHKLFDIIRDLKKSTIHFTLCVTRDEAVTIIAAVPGQRWEIEVFQNGDVEVEVFRSTGDILDEKQLRDMIDNSMIRQLYSLVKLSRRFARCVANAR